ncbi:MAG: hypothetical protein CMJ18_06625 [Phycisphaeraceae bacterium]|nr:hypothetical protein [Phycisphaeraceae bacterium]
MQEFPTGTSDGITCLDYAHSYMWPYNKARDSVRVAIESRTILYDDEAGTATAYYLGASCKSEDTYGVNKDYGETGFRPGANTLFVDPNYDFTWIIGNGSAVIYRRGLDVRKTSRRGEPVTYREVRADTTETWGESRLQLRPATGAYDIPADEFEPAARATDAGDAIVAQTQIEDADTRLRAVIEYPVKTMNVSRAGYPSDRDASVWQIDTGPVGVPDLSRRYDAPVTAFSLGFIATVSRHPAAADFVLEQLTALPSPNDHVSVMHFSGPHSLRATNRLVGIPMPA